MILDVGADGQSKLSDRTALVWLARSQWTSGGEVLPHYATTGMVQSI